MSRKERIGQVCANKLIYTAVFLKSTFFRAPSSVSQLHLSAQTFETYPLPRVTKIDTFPLGLYQNWSELSKGLPVSRFLGVFNTNSLRFSTKSLSLCLEGFNTRL